MYGPPFVKNSKIRNGSEFRNGFEFRNSSEIRNGFESLGMVPKLVQNNYETRSKLLRSWFRKCRNGSEKSCRDDKFGDWEQD